MAHLRLVLRLAALLLLLRLARRIGSKGGLAEVQNFGKFIAVVTIGNKLRCLWN